MNTSRLDRFHIQLQAHPLDLRSLNAADAARALFDFIQRISRPGDECFVVDATAGRGARVWQVLACQLGNRPGRMGRAAYAG